MDYVDLDNDLFEVCDVCAQRFESCSSSTAVELSKTWKAFGQKVRCIIRVGQAKNIAFVFVRSFSNQTPKILTSTNARPDQ